MLELAAIVSETLEAAGIVATLSGGSAVSAYSENRYKSESIDWKEIDGWVLGEGIASTQEVTDFYRAFRRQPPVPLA